MALSNPTSKSEALPQDLLAWTDGKALVATGSPFDPVVHAGHTYTIAQANNALVFPGLGLGIIVSRASRVTDGMFLAAATEVAQRSDADELGAPLIPGIGDVQSLSRAVAVAVAEAAIRDGVAQADLPDIAAAVAEAWWHPEYPIIEAV
jgi:malate dehydrogenase (oxaloacetate-decarboxylating)